MKVAVLMGGTSAERNVSLSTGKQILESLAPEKYTVYALDTATGQAHLPSFARPVGKIEGAGGDAVTALTQLPLATPQGKPDVVFIALHGPGGEDGSVQGFLETLGVPYTGSGVLASALAMDKVRYKQFLAAESIPMAPDLTFYRRDTARNRRAGQEVADQLGYPVFVKAARQGSSYGISLVKRAEDMAQALTDAFRYDDQVLVEPKLEGIEITVGVLGNDEPIALPVVEIISPSSSEFFDFAAKYTRAEDGGAIEIVPAEHISGEDAREAQQLAVQCHRLLGCRGMSRTDMFVTEDGVYVLETNTIPGMTPNSLLPKAAAAAGISFEQLLDKLIAYALEK